MVNPAEVPAGFTFQPIEDIADAAVDVLSRRFNDYKPTDLDAIKRFVFGDPAGIQPYPTLCVIPADGQVEENSCSVYTGEQRFLVRIYWKFVEKPGKNVYRDMTQVVDTLRLVFYRNSTLPDSSGAARVIKANLGQWFIDSFVQESRQDGNKFLFLVEAELTVRTAEGG